MSRIERFGSTHWSLVDAARGDNSGERRAAQSRLFDSSWYPIYGFIRSQGFGRHEAEDLTQGFFAHLLEKDGLARIDRAKGRFRSFMLSSCSNYLANHREYQRALKRGGGRTIYSLDADKAEARYAGELDRGLDPEALFQKRWALALLEDTGTALQHEYARLGRAALFDRLKPCLIGDCGASRYAEIGRDLEMTEPAVRAAAFRLRGRFAAILRESIARTVADPRQVEEEIRDLFAALSH